MFRVRGCAPLSLAASGVAAAVTVATLPTSRVSPSVAGAKASGAGLVVCGHSHVPFAAHDRGLTVFNPGSVGPRRFHLPIVFGVIEVRAEGVSLRHVDCETGLPWTPSTAAARGE